MSQGSLEAFGKPVEPQVNDNPRDAVAELAIEIVEVEPKLEAPLTGWQMFPCK